MMSGKRLKGSGLVSVLLVLLLAANSLTYGQHHEKHKKHKHHHRHHDRKISVVSSLPGYASIAEDIGGDLVTVQHIAAGNQDPHFVQPKPSYALMMRKAHMFITTGLDLELWVPALIDKARNKRIFEGAVGYVSAATDVPLLDQPKSNPDRSLGDVHVYGNPHIHTSPLNMKIVAENILIGLKKVAPENAEIFEANYESFVDRIDRALFGDELVDMFGGEVLSKMLMSGTLIEFLEASEYGGEKLINKLGGWLKKALPFRGQKIIAYHKNWIYFARDFGLNIVDYIEPKPGIPPTAKHVKEVIEKIENQKIQVMIVANYFEKRSPRMIAERTGIEAVFVPFDVGGKPGVNTYFDLIDCWIDKLNEAFGTSR
jgi:ABC-type Zn uptake system ZnuABC Zn-binding protein ZnuA